MSLLHDLDDFKLETSFEKDTNFVLHTSYKADRARGIRKVAVVERWAPHGPELGVGTFGTVRLQERRDYHDGTEVVRRAVKQLYKSQMSRMNIDFKKELLALTKFSRSKFTQYQVFVEFFGWFENDESIFLAMEYFPEGTLDGFIKSGIGEDNVRAIASQLLEGLKIMHTEGFTHRDLKPQNIFVVQTDPSWWVKIGDFGITKRVSNNDTALQTATGTPHYLAPEVYGYVDDEDDESDAYTNAVDIWSFGCVVYEMMARQVPFPMYPRDIIAFCRGGQFPENPLARREISKEGIDFIKMVMMPSPTLRPPATKIIDAAWLITKVNEVEDGSPRSMPASKPKTGFEAVKAIVDTAKWEAHKQRSQNISIAKDVSRHLGELERRMLGEGTTPQKLGDTRKVNGFQPSPSDSGQPPPASAAYSKPLTPISTTAFKTPTPEISHGINMPGSTDMLHDIGIPATSPTKFVVLDSIDTNWRENWGNDLKTMGITEDLIEENQDFIADYIKQQKFQASLAAMPPSPPAQFHDKQDFMTDYIKQQMSETTIATESRSLSPKSDIADTGRFSSTMNSLTDLPSPNINAFTRNDNLFSGSWKTLNLKVKIVSATGLCKRDKFRTPDVWAQCDVKAAKGLIIRSHSTGAIHGLNPRWNQIFEGIFTHNQTSFNEFVFEFTVFDIKNATKRGGGFLGEADLRVSLLFSAEISKLMNGIPIRKTLPLLEGSGDRYGMKVTGEISVELQITSPDIPHYANPTTSESPESSQKYPDLGYSFQHPASRSLPPSARGFIPTTKMPIPATDLTPFHDLKGNKLPPGWERQTMVGGQTYYVNHNTRSTVWNWKDAITDTDGTPLPEGWERRATFEGRTYYADHNSKKNTWISPNKK